MNKTKTTTSKKPNKAVKIILIVALSLIAALLLAAISYAAYVLATYYRVPDNQVLSVSDKTGEKAPIGERLTLMTYNIGFGAYSDDYSFFMDGGEHSRALSKQAVIDNTNGALSTLKAKDPDFVLLQEVDIDGTRSYHVDQTKMLSDGFPTFDSVFGQNYDSPYFIYPFHEPIGANRAGLMTFSAFDITSALRRSLPVENNLYQILDLDRAYTVSVVKTADPEKDLIIYNVHLSAYTSDGTIADEQMKMLASDMAAQYAKGNYIIAAGDFNKDLLGDSGVYFIRSEGEFTWAKPFDTSLLPDGFTLHTGKNAPTCRNADSPFRADGTDFILSVDGVIVSDNIEVISCLTEYVGFAYSDHNPVTIEFILK